jgi:hypothetical protein
VRTRVVQAPDGLRWEVRRRWATRLGNETLWGRFRRRIRGTGSRGRALLDGADVADGCVFDDLLVGVAVAIAVILVVVLLVFVMIPLLVALVDLLILLLLGLLGLFGRIVFRRPWTVEARGDDDTVRRWKVVGWRASAERRDEIAALLAAGITPPGGEVPRSARAQDGDEPVSAGEP